MTTPGKYRHLTQSSTPAGHFSILAIDHRANLRAALDKHAPAPVTDDQFVDFKRQVIGHLLPAASAVLTDPVYGMGVGISEGLIGGQKGLLAPLEETNYDVHPSQRHTRWLEGWSVARIKRVGGTGVKLLLYYHPDDPAAPGKRDLVAGIIAACARQDIPFFLEPIAYSLDPSRGLNDDELLQVLVETARTFSLLGVDVLKIEFPAHPSEEPDEAAWSRAARELDAACTIPWALLSAGVSYEIFRLQARIACEAGASGVIAGRAIWGEAIQLQGEARISFLQTTARARMEELAALCARSARDWRTRVPAPVMASGWHHHYSE